MKTSEPYSQPGEKGTDTNQASEDKPVNQHLVCLWQLQDIEETIADATPEELVDLHSKLVALSTDITEAVHSAIRTEKLKLLAEVRERVVGEDDRHDNGQTMVNDPSLCMDCTNPDERFARNTFRADQRILLDKLEAEL